MLASAPQCFFWSNRALSGAHAGWNPNGVAWLAGWIGFSHAEMQSEDLFLSDFVFPPCDVDFGLPKEGDAEADAHGVGACREDGGAVSAGEAEPGGAVLVPEVEEALQGTRWRAKL